MTRSLFAFSFCVFAMASASPSWACSPTPPTIPPTVEQRQESAKRRFEAEDALVELTALSTSDDQKIPARARVLRVYKGTIRPGETIYVYSSPSSMCGTGPVRAGSRGITYLSPVKPGVRYLQGVLKTGYFFFGYLGTQEYADLLQQGLLKHRRP